MNEASNAWTNGMSSPSSQITGSGVSLPWSCHSQDGVMMKSPGCITVRSPPTAV